MWYQDIQAKTAKEEEKNRLAHERNRHVAGVLKEQMKVLDDQKLEEKRIKNENTKLIVNKLNEHLI